MNIRRNSKWKNYGLWMSTISNAVAIGTLMNVDLDKYGKIALLILGILVQFGIISNPSKGQGYSDK